MAAGIHAVHDRLSGIWRPLASVAVLIAAAEAAKWGGLLPVFVPAPAGCRRDQIIPGSCTAVSGPPPGRPAWLLHLRRHRRECRLHRRAGPRPLCPATISASCCTRCRSLQRRLLALWLGTGPQVQIGSLHCQPISMLVGTMQACRRLMHASAELMYVLSATRAQTLRYLLVPSALPTSSPDSRSQRLCCSRRHHRRMGRCRPRRRRDDAYALFLRYTQGLARRVADLHSRRQRLRTLGADRAARNPLNRDVELGE